MPLFIVFMYFHLIVLVPANSIWPKQKKLSVWRFFLFFVTNNSTHLKEKPGILKFYYSENPDASVPFRKLIFDSTMYKVHFQIIHF
jgi:hypothetical protein